MPFWVNQNYSQIQVKIWKIISEKKIKDKTKHFDFAFQNDISFWNLASLFFLKKN